MKRSIIIRGQSSSGKTFVLINFYNWIINTYNPTVIYNYPYPNGDFKALLQLNNLQISFFTQGDYEHEVDLFLSNAIAIGSDLIICSCRARGGTYRVLSNHLQYPNFLVDYVQTHHVPMANIAAFQNLKLDELKTRIIGLPK